MLAIAFCRPQRTLKSAARAVVLFFYLAASCVHVSQMTGGRVRLLGGWGRAANVFSGLCSQAASAGSIFKHVVGMDKAEGGCLPGDAPGEANTCSGTHSHVCTTHVFTRLPGRVDSVNVCFDCKSRFW